MRWAESSNEGMASGHLRNLIVPADIVLPLRTEMLIGREFE
jgi:hypothetical protein